MNTQLGDLKVLIALILCLFAAVAYGGTIGVQPVFDPGAIIPDAVKLRYHFRVNSITADTTKIIFQGRRLYNPSCSGQNCQTYLLESNLYTYWVNYGDTGCVPWPPTNAGPSYFGQAALWLSIPDYNQKGMVGSRPVNNASEQMFPRVMTGIDNIIALTKIETMSQMNIAGQDIAIEYARGSTFTAPLSGWGWRFDPNVTVSNGQPPCIADLPAGVVYRIWTATVTMGTQTYSYEFAVPDQYATHLAPSEIFSIVTEFMEKTPEEISAGKGDFQVYFWNFEVQRENFTTWIPLRKMKVFYRADPSDNIGWGAKIGTYAGRSVLEVSNDTTDTYYKLNDVFEIPVCATDVSTAARIVRGGFRFNRTTGRFVQTVTLRNTGTMPIQGPVSLVLDSFSNNATLYAPAGATACVAPTGSPYVNVNVGTDNVLSSGESTMAALEFTNASKRLDITYTTRVLAGTGTR